MMIDIEKYFEDVIIMDKRTVTDQISGTSSVWVEGALIRAGIVTDSTTAAKIAYQNGAKIMYTVVYTGEYDLDIGDRIKRIKDGTIMVVKSSPADMSPPDGASDMMQYRQVRAEAVKL
jgi:hypothetical protein